MKTIYYIECGVLLDKDNRDYDCYNNVFDKKHSFYDEYVDFVDNFTKAKRDCYNYIKNGVNGTYGIISKINVPKELNRDSYYDYLAGEKDLYDINNVIYNAWKLKNNQYKYPNKNGKIIENFLN